MTKILRFGLPPVSNPISDTLRDFVGQCNALNPTMRPTAESLLKHAFIKNVNIQQSQRPLQQIVQTTREALGL
jgi:serine/threonine protein kinase